MLATTELPIHPVTGLQAIGLLLSGAPVWPAVGAAEDDDGDVGMDLTGGKGGKPAASADDDADDDDAGDSGGQDDDSDDSDDAKDDWKPPTKDEWEKVQASLAEANGQAKKHRLRVQEIRKEQRASAAARSGAGGDGDDDAAARDRKAAEAAEQRFKPIAVRSAARAALLTAGLNDPSDQVMKKLLRLVDMDDVDLDNDGDPIGLDEQVEDIKDTFPKLFEKLEVEKPADQQQRRRPPKITGAGRENNRPEPKTTGERHAARLGIGPQ